MANFKLNRLPEEQRETTKEAIESQLLTGAEPLEGELEQPVEFREMINLANTLIERYCSQFGIEPGPEVTPDRVHILSSEAFKDITGKDIPATYRTSTHSIMVNSDNQSIEQVASKMNLEVSEDLALFTVLLEETLHYRAYKAYSAYDDEAGAIRSGLTSINFARQKDYFDFFDELVVHKMMSLIISESPEEIADHFGISREQISNLLELANANGNLSSFDKLLENLSNTSGESIDDCWRQMLAAEFEGDMRVIGQLIESIGPENIKKISRIGR